VHNNSSNFIIKLTSFYILYNYYLNIKYNVGNDRYKKSVNGKKKLYNFILLKNYCSSDNKLPLIYKKNIIISILK
jgi:hypothetical protein